MDRVRDPKSFLNFRCARQGAEGGAFPGSDHGSAEDVMKDGAADAVEAAEDGGQDVESFG